MATVTEQTREKHARVDPAFHYFIAPVLLLFVVWTLYRLVFSVVFLARHWGQSYPVQTSQLHQYLLLTVLSSVALFVLALALFMLSFKARTYALRVQDRLIRLEERIRLLTIAPDSVRTRVGALTERQLIALRFAPDDEVAALAARALEENLSPKQIKDAVGTWRPDHFRV